MNQPIRTPELIQQWLDQYSEDAIDAQRPICDPHHHLWDYPTNTYMLEHLMADVSSSGHNIESTVYMECGYGYRVDTERAMRVVGEVEFCREVHKQAQRQGLKTEVNKGYVGRADMMLDINQLQAVLEAMVVEGGDRFKGIRHATAYVNDDAIDQSHTKPQPRMMRDSDFVEGVDLLGQMGLTFDGWLYHEQIAEFTALARSVPNTRLILDHLGGPVGIGSYTGQHSAYFDKWRADIEELAKCDNVFMKLGGVAMYVNGFGWHDHSMPPTSDQYAEVYGDWMHACINAFGAERCMFESNFPVDRVSISYNVLWNGFKKIAQSYTQTEQDNLFIGSAERCYDL